jgi:hypothetical protein
MLVTMHGSGVANRRVEDGSMKRILLASIIGGCIVVGGTSIYSATNWPGSRLIPGTGPITEQQIRDKLTADGFSNIQITLQGNTFQTVATRNGRPTILEIDAQSGIVHQDRDDDED